MNTSYNMSPRVPAAAMADTSSVARSDVAPLSHEAKLRGEVDFLQKKIKYIQSVSTIFRQKIALIMRECSKNPNSFPEYHKMYAKVLGEVTRAEEELDGDGPQKIAAIATTSAAASAEGHGLPSDTERRQRRDDVDRAHHLCVLLAEKNEIKAREIDLRERCETLQAAYDDVKERYSRLVELQSSGVVGAGGGLAQVQVEAFRERERALEKAVFDAKAEVAAVIARSQTPAHTASLADGVGFAGEGALGKQNALLKSRIERLKRELAAQAEEHAQGSRQLQLNVETLVAQLHSVKREAELKEWGSRKAASEKLELEGELSKERQITTILQSKCAALEQEIARLSKVDQNAPGAAAVALAGGPSRMVDGLPVGMDAADFIDVYKARAEDAERRSETLQDELWRLEAAATQKDTEIAALGAQIRAFRSRIDSFEAERDQRDVQRSMVAEVETRVMAAVREIQHSQTTSALADQMGSINGHLKRLEGLELQLRQKEDLLALSEDELAQLKQTHQELLDSLNAVSALFTSLPNSVSSMERLVIEHSEYKAELYRCADSRTPPDIINVHGKVELRCLEAETARKKNRRVGHTDGQGIDQHQHGLLGAGMMSDLSPRRGTDFAVDGAIPSPPPLLDITASLHAGHGNVSAASRLDASTLRGAAAGDLSSFAIDAEPGALGPIVSDDDARITFHLFDERGLGVLPADVIRLCLTTLALPTSLLPVSCKSMTAAEFMALCVNRQRGLDSARAAL